MRKILLTTVLGLALVFGSSAAVLAATTPTATFSSSQTFNMIKDQEQKFSFTVQGKDFQSGTLVRYKALFEQQKLVNGNYEWSPVQGQVISYTGGIFTTNDKGVAYFGPETGFDASLVLPNEKDVTTDFTAKIATAGKYKLTIELVTVDEKTIYGSFEQEVGVAEKFGFNSTLTSADVDNKEHNFNQTGQKPDGSNAVEGETDNVADVIKSDNMVNNKGVAGNQRTHGEYQNNTNSCASCHQTHTGASENLLFKNGVYETCSACHDGTLGFYNVFQASTAGTFEGTVNGNPSIHMANSVMQIKAAPGGNMSATSRDWTAEFSCASCHSPHGSYSDRLLNYNPNGVGSTDMYFRAADGSYTDKDGNPSSTPVKTGGLKIVGAPVVSDLKGQTAEYVVYKTTSQNSTLGANTIPVEQEPSDIPVIVLMKKKADGTYERDMSPWIGNVYNTRNGKGLDEITNFFKSNAYPWGTPLFYETDFVKFSANPQVNTDDGIIVKFGYAYVKNGPANGIDSVRFANISRATLVKFNFITDKSNFNGIPIKEVNVNSYNDAKGTMGVQISQFCAACHTDYFVSAGTDDSGLGRGVWSKAFRHNTTSNSYTCLKCHFAHGTDISVMLDAKDQTLADVKAKFTTDGVSSPDTAAENYMRDVNASSALKRYTNMSVCWKCHTSSHSEDMTNNQWVQGVNSGYSSTEYNKTGKDLPQGWVAPDQAKLPY